MRITVKLSKQAESTRKNLPIDSRAAIDDCIGQLESSTFVVGERNLSNTGYICLPVYPTWELIIFTREEKRALLTREKIYQVNIIKITTRDYLEDFISKQLPKNGEVSGLATSQLSQVSKLRRLGRLVTDSLDQAGRFSIVFAVTPIIIGFLLTLLISNTSNSNQNHQPENSPNPSQQKTEKSMKQELIIINSCAITKVI
ncbi:hypothetical protein [Crocosphaera sp.]|uniref:hypothetical protein n=1 Tax=Crocosphaera sp. TaxID=2729996 RepID=UPI0026081AC2|nr:hypothetical protein [Crocosphaera sp.]MDJ0582976.1 hypothetical protein [Crocosphaera sp.]